MDIDQDRVNNRSNQISQLDSFGGVTSYERNGNMTQVPRASNSFPPYNAEPVVWDAWNRMRKVTVYPAQIECQYDALWRRTLSSTGVTKHYYYNDQ